jgi:hypothetical protein
MDGLKYGVHQLGNIWRRVLSIDTHNRDIWSQVRQVQLYGHWSSRTLLHRQE